MVDGQETTGKAKKPTKSVALTTKARGYMETFKALLQDKIAEEGLDLDLDLDNQVVVEKALKDAVAKFHQEVAK